MRKAVVLVIALVAIILVVLAMWYVGLLNGTVQFATDNLTTLVNSIRGMIGI